MFGGLFELLLQLLDALARFHSRRAGHRTPQRSQAGLFAVVLGGLDHGGGGVDLTASILTKMHG